MTMNIFAKPEPQSNAAALAGISALGLLGVVLSDNPVVQSLSLASTLVVLLTSCAISNTEFGKQSFEKTLCQNLPSKERVAWFAAISTTAILGYCFRSPEIDATISR